jgi:putative nucleotidyltransferase with HDIG domain
MLPAGVSKILEIIHNLKPMPASVTDILQIVDDPKVEIPQIAALIGRDQVLAALVLQMANSVTLGYNRNCSSIPVAVMRIGLNRLKAIILVSSSYQSMNRALSGYRLGAGELWQHAQNTAHASEVLAKFLRYQNVEAAYISGLVHDIGKLVLNQVIVVDYTRMNDFISQYNMTLWEIEKKLIGIDHAQVGGLMAEKWNLPGELVEAVRFHHYPADAPNPILPAIVNLANLLTLHHSHGKDWQTGDENSPTAISILGIVPEALPKIYELADSPSRGTFEH